jgi:hypothetical protein
VWLDGKVETTELDAYLEQVAAPAAWDLGLDGQGTTIAVLDTGVDAGHPDLAGQVVATQNFTDEADAEDRQGHGTHVASLAAGTGAGADGARMGLAPGAEVISGKVLDNEGQGQESWVIAGMEWAVDQGADVVNLSLSGQSDGDNPVDEALEALAAESDTLFVAAAGNAGGRTGGAYSIGSPGTSPSALTVGAVTAEDYLASFSSRGPTWGTYRLKPDLAAPGVELLGAKAGARDGDLYTAKTGTSMASPVVAGAAALLRQQHPDWSAEQVKARLMSTADPNNWYNAWTYGAGRLDLAAATQRELSTDTTSLDFGLLPWPHEGTQQATATISNDGTEPVSLDAEVFLAGDLTIPAPEGSVAVEPQTLTIPAGASAEVTVTIDLDVLETGPWQGILSVGAGDAPGLRIPVGAYVEPETYDLDLQVLDRNGDPWDPSAGAGLTGVDPTIPIFNGRTGGFIRLHPDAQGQVSARVPRGDWMVLARVYTPGADGAPGSVTVTGTAELTVDQDLSHVLDARDGQPLGTASVTGHDTQPDLAVPFIYSRTGGGRGYGEIVYLDPQTVADGGFLFTPTEPVQFGAFEALTRWWLEPVGEVRDDGADAYDVVSSRPALDAGLTPTLTQQDLDSRPRLEQRFHPVGEPGSYWVTQFTNIGQLTAAMFGLSTEVTSPGSREVLVAGPESHVWVECLTAPANDMRQMCDAGAQLADGQQLRRSFGATMHPLLRETRHSVESLFVSAGVTDGRHESVFGRGTVEDQTLELQTLDGTTLGTADDSFAYFRFGERGGRFRLVHDVQTVPGQLSSMTEARTVWEFTSAPPGPGEGSATVPAFLSVDYGFDLQPDGTVGRRPLFMDLDVTPSTGDTPAPRIEQMSVAYSTDDGGTWQVVRLRRTGEHSFQGMVLPPSFRGADHLSFRLRAVDTEGNSIKQTTRRLLEVRP